jgi:hypothetical protein
VSDPKDGAAAGQPGSGAQPGQPAAAASEYFVGRTIPEDQRPAYDQLAGQLVAGGVPSKIGNAAVAWFEANAGKPITAPQIKHKYDWSGPDFRREDRPYLDSFGNAMAAVGATQDQVDALLRVREPARREQCMQNIANQREIERQDAEDARNAAHVMQREWGTEYEANRRLIAGYLRRLPTEERDKFELQPNAEGVLPLNDPARLRELVVLARGGGTAAPSGKTEAQEFAELRALIANPYSNYWKGADAERNQARYRDLIAKGYS